MRRLLPLSCWSQVTKVKMLLLEWPPNKRPARCKMFCCWWLSAVWVTAASPPTVSCHKDRLCQQGEECNQTGPSAWLQAAATPQPHRSVLQLSHLAGWERGGGSPFWNWKWLFFYFKPISVGLLSMMIESDVTKTTKTKTQAGEILRQKEFWNFRECFKVISWRQLWTKYLGTQVHMNPSRTDKCTTVKQ